MKKKKQTLRCDQQWKKKNQHNEPEQTETDIPDFRLFSNLVACSFSKKLALEPPCRPPWRTVSPRFLGPVQPCLAGL